MGTQWNTVLYKILFVGCVMLLAGAEDLELKHVLILIRHSVRAPVEFDKGGLINASLYPMGAGELTSLGRRLAFKAGPFFRDLYRDLLTDNPHEVWARSSTIRRCFETVSLMLSTMYPPRGVFSWNETLDWQPIQIQNVPQGHDMYLEACDNSIITNFTYMFDQEGPPGFKTVGEFFNYVTELTGYNSDEFDFFIPVIDALYAHKWNQYSVPKWAEDNWLAIEWAIHHLLYEHLKLQGLSVGVNIRRGIADRLKQMYSDKQNTGKLSIFGYHDFTIQALFATLKMDPAKYFPLFMGSVHFHLLQDTKTKQFYVKTFYSQGFDENHNYVTPTSVIFPGCSLTCPMETMDNILRGTTPDGFTDDSNCPRLQGTLLL